MAKRNVDYTPVSRFLSPGLAFCMQLLFSNPTLLSTIPLRGCGGSCWEHPLQTVPSFLISDFSHCKCPNNRILRTMIKHTQVLHAKAFPHPALLLYLRYQRRYSHRWGVDGWKPTPEGWLFFDPIVGALNNRIRKNDHQTFITLPIPS